MASNSWSVISPPTVPGEDKIRRADHQHPLEFFRGLDFKRRHLFLFRTPGGESEDRELPNLAGIEVRFEPVDNIFWQLRLTLQDAQQADLFAVLCANLMESTRAILPSDTTHAVDVVIGRLGRWQKLLERGRSALLSEGAQIGLFGELLFLREVLLTNLNLPPYEAMLCWRGPYGDEQDFSVRGILVEIKSQRDTSDSRVGISSAEQLDPVSGPVFLCHQTFLNSGEHGDGQTLLELVESLLAQVESGDPAASDILRSALLELGFEAKPEYGETARALQTRTFYDVRDGFPRIVPGMIAAGIREVRYTLELATCADYITDMAEIWKRASHV